MNLFRLALGVIVSLLSIASSSAAERPDFILGVDANYALEMDAKGAAWKWNGQGQELFAGMHEQGVQWLRVRLWTGDDGVNGKSYATQVVERASKAGLTPYVVIFLSENWADLTKQPAPAMWQKLSIDQRADAVEKYCREIVTHFLNHGLTSHIYEIGNEIDNGICGVFASKSSRDKPERLATETWPDEAKLILAAEKAVKKSDSDAKFLLHIAHWWDPEFCTSFFRFMLDHSVQIDYAGLSYFPSSGIGGSLTFDQFGTVIERVTDAVHRPVVICETAYPSTAEFTGQFAAWKKEAPGYPLTPEGQQKWLTDFLTFCRNRPDVEGVFYWSPEWYGEGMWKAFALFDTQGNARPAWRAFGGHRLDRVSPHQY